MYHQPTIYTFLLLTMCLMLLAFISTRLLISLWNKNKLFSWFTGFYLLCFMWTAVRSGYWIMIETRESMTYLQLYVLYWSPTPIQFANFSLLALFYIQVLTGRKWRTHWRQICLPLYAGMTIAMASFTVVWALTTSKEISYAYEFGNEDDEEFYKISDVKVQLIYSAISYFLLSFLFGFFGWKMANVASWKQRQMLISKPRTLAWVNFLLCVIFFTRSVRDLATSQNWFLDIWNELDMNGQVTSFAYFIFFCIWEFLPTALLLYLISTKAGGVGAPRHNRLYHRQKLPDFGLFHVINSHLTNTAISEKQEQDPYQVIGEEAAMNPLWNGSSTDLDYKYNSQDSAYYNYGSICETQGDHKQRWRLASLEEAYSNQQEIIEQANPLNETQTRVVYNYEFFPRSQLELLDSTTNYYDPEQYTYEKEPKSASIPSNYSLPTQQSKFYRYV